MKKNDSTTNYINYRIGNLLEEHLQHRRRPWWWLQPPLQLAMIRWRHPCHGGKWRQSPRATNKYTSCIYIYIYLSLMHGLKKIYLSIYLSIHPSAYRSINVLMNPKININISVCCCKNACMCMCACSAHKKQNLPKNYWGGDDQKMKFHKVSPQVPVFNG